MPLRYCAVVAGVAATVFATLASAQVDGRYDAVTCQSAYRSQTVLDVAWPTISFFESSCTITGAVAGVANTYTTYCDGEGQQWHGQVMISVNANGSLNLENNGDGTVILYNRC